MALLNLLEGGNETKARDGRADGRTKQRKVFFETLEVKSSSSSTGNYGNRAQLARKSSYNRSTRTYMLLLLLL